jgi:PAS domain S-box-containing protein
MFLFLLSLITFSIAISLCHSALTMWRTRNVDPGMVRAYWVITFCVGFWCTGYSLMYHAHDAEEIQLYYKFSAIGWAMLPSAIVYLVLQMHATMTGRKEKPLRSLMLFIPYPFFLAAAVHGRILATGFERKSYGIIEYIPELTAIGAIFSAASIAALGSCFILLAIRFRNTTLNKHRSQIMLIIIPAAAMGTVSIFVNIVFALLDLPRPPALAHILMGLWALHLGYLLRHYPMLNMHPQFALDAILFNMNDMVILTGKDRRIVKANRAAERLLGYTKDELTGRDASILFKDGSDHFAKAPACSDPSFFESGLLCRDGSSIPCHCSLQLLKDSFQDPVGFAVFARDIRDMKKIEALADKMMKQKEELHSNYEQIERKNHRMQMELELARQIQHSLVPQTPPLIEGISFSMIYKPMTEIGGDLYDFVPFHYQKKIGLFICDVSGHGVPAALVSGMIKTFLMTSGESREHPDELLSYINSRITGQICNNFITAFYCVYDLETRVLSYARAGHPFPRLIRDGKILRLQSRGIMLGFNEKITPEVRTIQLEHGDKLLLFTDGLLETTDSSRTFFEDTRFEEVLAAHSEKNAARFTEALFNDVNEYKGKRDFDDDVCLLCMEVL